MNEIHNPVLKGIWEDRYQKNGETLEENYRRVAKYIAQDSKEEEDFYHVISEGLFLPAGRTMSNCGIGENLTLNNCFTAPQIPDDLKKIFDTVKLGAITHKAGGGIGYDFSLLRPEGTPTSNDAIASGPVSFMEVFNTQTSTILQGNRRGANMGVMNIYHPDIMKFITAKTTSGKFEHFNLSVMVDDAFMIAMQNDEDVYLHYPVYDKDGKILTDASKWTHQEKVKAKELWDSIMKLAYDNGEPGIFFYDNMNKDNNLWYTENIVCSNPCSEYLAGTVYDAENPQDYGGACNLGSLILPHFIKNPFTNKATVDWEKLINTIQIAVKMLDRIIDINKFPDKIYENYQKRFRTIGLGITGLGDMLVMLNLKYSSQQARDFVDQLMNVIACQAYATSAGLAMQYGAFLGYDSKLLKSGYITKHYQEGQENAWNNICHIIDNYGLRNAKIMSVAPTGTMSLTFGNNCSSGIEPIFSLEYERKVKFGGQSEDDIQVVKIRDYAYDMWLKIKDNPECIVTKDVFETALDLSVDAHVDMLAVIAKHVDMSVSKTINIPTDYSFEDTKDVYLKCWKNKIKGCTIFRPNEIRQGILISPNSNEQNNSADNEIVLTEQTIPRGTIMSVPEDLNYKKFKLHTGCGKLYFFVGYDDNGVIYDCFTNTDGTGGCTINTQAVSRLLSACIRGGVPVEYIVEQLQKSGTCPSFQYARGKGKKLSVGSSCPSAIGYVLKSIVDSFDIEKAEEAIEELNGELIEEVKNAKSTINTENKKVCPDCGAEIVYEGGCNVCKSCGWSKCG